MDQPRLARPVELGCICDGRNGIPLSATATFTTSTLSAGTHSITAVYGGDSNNASSTSSILSQVVNAPTFTVTTTEHPAPAPAGTSTTSTFIVTATGGATTFVEAVTFACNGPSRRNHYLRVQHRRAGCDIPAIGHHLLSSYVRSERRQCQKTTTPSSRQPSTSAAHDLATSGRRHAWLRGTQALEILDGRWALRRISLRRIPDRLR